MSKLAFWGPNKKTVFNSLPLTFFQPRKPQSQPKMFKQHLEMIGSYEPISKKARFFNTYLKTLKGKWTVCRPFSVKFTYQFPLLANRQAPRTSSPRRSATTARRSSAAAFTPTPSSPSSASTRPATTTTRSARIPTVSPRG